MSVKLYPQIVLFGDSLFQGAAASDDGYSFQGTLQSRYNRRYDVINRGLSGWTSSNALEYLPQIIPPASESTPRIEYIFILLGANDAVLKLPWTKQHVPLATYEENLKKIVTHANITSHKPKIFIVTPPPLDEIHTTRRGRDQGDEEPFRDASVAAEYSETARKVAKEKGVGLVDLYQALMDKAVELTPGFDASGPKLGTPKCGQQGGLKDLLYDGLHMTGEAYRVFYNLVVPLVEDEWASASDEDRKRQYLFPDWKVVNP
ncbi:related to IAH1 Isoamyl acetate hydrolytic enzyme [Cephalotrichum gorgonifer]|uniref:Related to IAH1 Isoamyl acetate hydrolytic enzyme n=1 Tax=Cephalotrichum gorgonifer TaxID=2041049 RepID=A0AAE8SS98_9PEZI|nr:related to IAH1 Isoamyl acetate hydrolytic enzyme [Cephalotrichum gorgonifer]